MHVDPMQFMSTVSAVHQDETGKEGLNKLSLPLKISPKVTTDRKKEAHRRETLVPDFDPSELTPLEEVSRNRLNNVRTSGRERSNSKRIVP